MVLVQKWPFWQLVFFRQYKVENVFYDILERKNAFLGYKNKKFQKSKNWHLSKGVNSWFWTKTRSSKSRKIDIFPKGLTHGFGPKMGIFLTFFFLGYIGQENVFYDIVERINAFLGYKNKKFKQSKNWHFCKGVNPWFWPQNGYFCNFIFRQLGE